MLFIFFCKEENVFIQAFQVRWLAIIVRREVCFLLYGHSYHQQQLFLSFYNILQFYDIVFFLATLPGFNEIEKVFWTLSKCG